MPTLSTEILVVLGVLNFLAFICVGWDKQKSVSGQDRLPEVFLFFIAVLFASLGVLLGMFAFRHKVRKVYFVLGIVLLLLEQVGLLILAAKVAELN